MRIKNIFIDFGGVIVRTENKEPRIQAATKLGITVRDLEKVIFESESGALASLGVIPEEAHWQEVANTLRLKKNDADEIVKEFFAGDRVDYTLVDFLREHRPTHKVALISNAWSGLRRFITREGLVDVFDHMVISAEVGVMKPDPRIFRIALEELQAKEEESVFVDDVLENVNAARAIGMLGVHFIKPDLALQELKCLLNEQR